eukprot:CAMPEP_0116034288 /NCGR_PEP_ID=MMETSP0321-20121206/19515_1 /TAXON_ID=163516 /ORGANISM="Leptocylindrus danicus var. danicus, Strain B650" /LENGTH=235 /DNA_ID=CAMNT_0003510565 /DNA_START=81 /DNA_END=788 /DNA_ORIENTATION=+
MDSYSSYTCVGDMYADKVVQTESSVARDIIHQGNILYRDGDFKYALSAYEEALELQEQSDHSGKHTIYIASTLNNIGLVHRKLGSTKKAMDCYTRALNIKRRVLGMNHEDVAVLLHNIGSMHADRKEFTEAMECFGEALMISLEKLGSNNINVGNILKSIGSVHLHRREFLETITFCSSALEIYKNVGLPRNHRSVFTARRTLDDAKRMLGDDRNATNLQCLFMWPMKICSGMKE